MAIEFAKRQTQGSFSREAVLSYVFITQDKAQDLRKELEKTGEDELPVRHLVIHRCYGLVGSLFQSVTSNIVSIKYCGRLDDDMISSIAAGIDSCDAIQSLDIRCLSSNFSVDTRTWEKVAAALAKCSDTLEDFYFSPGTGRQLLPLSISDPLVEAVCKAKNLHRLAIYCCRLSIQSMKSISLLLQSPSSLEKLNLTFCHFSFSGLGHLAAALPKANSLKTLYLRYVRSLPEETVHSAIGAALEDSNDRIGNTTLTSYYSDGDCGKRNVVQFYTELNCAGFRGANDAERNISKEEWLRILDKWDNSSFSVIPEFHTSLVYYLLRYNPAYWSRGVR